MTHVRCIQKFKKICGLSKRRRDEFVKVLKALFYNGLDAVFFAALLEKSKMQFAQVRSITWPKSTFEEEVV